MLRAMMPALRPVVRSLLNRPGYFTMVVGLVALGVAAMDTYMYVVSDVALIRPLPYHEPGALMSLKALEPVGIGDSINAIGLAPVRFARWRAGAPHFRAIEGLAPKTMAMVGTGDPEALKGMQVSSGLFALLGTSPERGRAFARDEEITNAAVAIVSHEFWQRRLAGDPNVLGQSVARWGRAHDRRRDAGELLGAVRAIGRSGCRCRSTRRR